MTTAKLAKARMDQAEVLFGITDAEELDELLWRFKAIIDILGEWDAADSQLGEEDLEEE